MADDYSLKKLENTPRSPFLQQNHLYPFSPKFIHWLKSTVGGKKQINITDVFAPSGFSNNIARLTFEDGRKLIIKQSPYDWARPRFKSARKSSQLIRRQSSVIAPKHIKIPEEVVEKPTIAYWYLPHSTLKDLWPDLSSSQRKQAAQSLGNMLRKIHQIKVSRYGLLHKEHSYQNLSAYMLSELRDRLKPAIAAKWPDILPLIDRLINIAKNLPNNEQQAPLVHNDMHLGNILCNTQNGEMQCVGLLDWEEAGGGPWEADLASAMTLHHPLFFSSKLKGSRLNNFGKFITEGYGETPDSKLLRFFRIYHLVDLGFFSAMNGDHQHAGQIGKKASGLLNAVA